MDDAMPAHLQDAATQSFLNLLCWFRIVLLQDAIFLRQQFPSLNLWLSPPFNHPLFEDFSNHLLHESTHGPDPTFVQIANVVPQIAHMIQDNFRNSATTMQVDHQSHEIHLNQIETKLNESLNITQPVSLFLHHLSAGGLHMRTHFTLDNDHTANAITASSEPHPNPTILTVERPVSSITSVRREIESSVPQYRLDPNIDFVTQLWEEYDQGIASQSDAPRGPSIRQLDEEYGAKWRQSEQHRKAYSRRR